MKTTGNLSRDGMKGGNQNTLKEPNTQAETRPQPQPTREPQTTSRTITTLDRNERPIEQAIITHLRYRPCYPAYYKDVPNITQKPDYTETWRTIQHNHMPDRDMSLKIKSLSLPPEQNRDMPYPHITFLPSTQRPYTDRGDLLENMNYSVETPPDSSPPDHTGAAMEYTMSLSPYIKKMTLKRNREE